MSRKTIQVLAAIVAILVVLLLVMRSNDAGSPSQLLIPDLKPLANTAEQIRITGASSDAQTTIHRQDDAWSISERDDYAADLGKIRQLIIALADAKIVEEKTSDEEKYDRLGVDDPSSGGKGLKVSITGPEFSYTVILGDKAQRNYRYARIEGEATSYLVDQNPNVTANVGDWLLPDIVDIDSNRIKNVSISHVGGDVLHIEKDTPEQSDFVVRDIPGGRELSYPSAGNSIAKALEKLKLDDVRRHANAEPSTTTVYRTWDGLVLTVEVVTDNGVGWATFSAEALPAETPNAADADSAEASEFAERKREADAINKRLSGWQYQLAAHKKDLIAREWKDILKAGGDETAK